MAENWTNEDLQALDKAIALGVTEVRYADKSVKYRTLAEMFQIRDRMREALGVTPKKPRRSYFKTSKGF